MRCGLICQFPAIWDKEEPMKKFLLLGASVALLSFAVIEEASAQRGGGFRGGGGAGFRGGMVGGGFRGATMGGGFRGGMVRGGFRSAAIGPGFRGGVVGPGFRGARWAGPGVGWRGRPFVGQRVAWAGGPWRRHRGWGWPLAAGLGFGLVASGAYYDSCWRYDGWQWVNVCYGPWGQPGYYTYY
jgi:hypothetical protein